MSAFGNYEQDGVVDEVKDFILSRKGYRPEMKLSEIMEELFNAINYGVKEALERIERESDK